MCVMCVGLWEDMDSHPDVRLYVLDGGLTCESHPICVVCVGLWVDAGMSPNVCHVRWIVRG